MRQSKRALAGALVLGVALTACGGGGGGNAGATSQLIPNAGSSTTPDLHPNIKRVIAAVPRPVGQFAVSDKGQMAANSNVRITITLNYNNQAELDQVVRNQSDPTSPLYHHYLTNSEFNSRYAPTAAQQTQVENALRSAGFTIAHEFDNRTIIDAQAPAKTVETAFNTEMHSVSQGKFGQRYMNVKPATLPTAIASLVKDVTLNNLVVMRTKSDVIASTGRTPAVRAISPRGGVLPNGGRRTMAVPFATNVVTNPGFESGAVNNGWSQCGNISASVVTTHPHSGLYDERSGNGTSEPNGDTGVCQAVTIPASGKLSFWVYQRSDETDTTYAYQEADLLDATGAVVANLYTSVANTNGWVQKAYDLSGYAGGSYYLYFGVHGDGYAYLYTQQFVDDVSLTSGSATPTPAPTPTPTPVPTSTPTSTPVPTSTPTHTPTPVPTATPGSGCTGSAPLNGASKSSGGGWLATGVAKAFDFPVQHGCNGAGQTVAVEIDTPIITSDVQTYLSGAGVTQTGTITNVAVDGGGNSASSDYTETALDVETISGLAPGANIRVYNFPDLSSQSIEDGYNQTVSDGLASVVNSSFGGCESSDTAFTNTTNSIAQQAASKGMTFAASSGDSGSAECSPIGVSAPASDPYFTAVGAVNFTANSNGTLATITSGTDSSNGFSSGGGYSTIFAVPSYQQGISGVNSSGRNNPDISLPGVGVAVYASSQGGWIAVDGTSWSSPEFVALMAEVNQLRNTHYGFVNPNLYTLFKNTSYTDYTDVTSGSNGAYSAVSGYDLVTGIGAPKGWAMANAL